MGTSGRESDVAPERALRVFTSDDSGTPLTAAEVAAELECSPPAAVDALERLVARGNLRDRSVGDDRVWWLASDRRAAADGGADNPEAAAAEVAAPVRNSEATSDDSTPADADSPSQDVSDREQLRGELRRDRNALQELYRVTSDNELSFEEKTRQLLALGCERLDLDIGFLSVIDEDERHFEVLEARGDHDLIQPGQTDTLSQTYCRRAIESDGLLGLRDAAAEGWADDPAYERYDLGCYLGGKVTVDGELFGSLCFADVNPREREFSDTERTFIELIVQWVSYDLERTRYQEVLERQRDELTAMNQLNELMQDVAHVVVDAASRGEIAQHVCERLAGSDPYESVQFGEFDPARDRIDVGASAGAEFDYEVDAELARRVLADGDTVALDESDVDADGLSVAVVPVAHEDVPFGVLVVTSRRSDAFVDRERVLLTGLGQTIGHAINAISRKEALMAEQVIQLEFRSTALGDLFAPELDDDGEITVDRTIPFDDGERIQFFTVRGMSDEAFEAAVRDVPLGEVIEVRQLGTVGEESRFEVRRSGDTLADAFAEYGGRFVSATIGRKEGRIVAQFPRDTDVRRVVEAVKETFPDLDLISQRTKERELSSPGSLQSVLDDSLTERQQQALEAAFYAGFFEWPRESTGEAVAESLGVTPPTFHSHMRKATRKVVAALFDESN